MAHFPALLHTVAIGSLALAGVCAITITVDEFRRPQKIWIMALVWPLTARFGSVLWLAVYYRWGRSPAAGAGDQPEAPFAVAVLKGSSHCGAGCTLGDIIAEWAAFGIPTIAVWFGYGTLFADKIFAIWVLDFIVAFGLGIVFQYFTIQPMRDLPVGEGVVAALKADIASISAWQVGMYGLMAIIQFAIFEPRFGAVAPVDSPEFWFAMQVAMLGGFATSYPVNWLLIRTGVKERM